MQCYAKESREDDLLGEGTVDIEETLKTYEFDGELLLLRQRSAISILTNGVTISQIGSNLSKMAPTKARSTSK